MQRRVLNLSLLVNPPLIEPPAFPLCSNTLDLNGPFLATSPTYHSFSFMASAFYALLKKSWPIIMTFFSYF